MSKKQIESVQPNSVSEDLDIDELNLLEEDEEIYKWLSVLLCIIWFLSLMVF